MGLARYEVPQADLENAERRPQFKMGISTMPCVFAHPRCETNTLI